MENTSRKPLGRPGDTALRERRREEILDAAVTLFARHGYHDADTQVLADTLQVAKGTLYRYFASKEELFLAAVDRVMKRLQAAVDASIEGVEEPLERISRGVHAYLQFFAEHAEFVELLIQERAQFKDRKKPTYFEHCDANIDPWKEMFRSLIDAGKVRDVPVERITDVISDLMYGTLFTNYFTGRRASFEAQATDILDIVFNGILTIKGKRHFPENR